MTRLLQNEPRMLTAALTWRLLSAIWGRATFLLSEHPESLPQTRKNEVPPAVATP